MTTVHESRQIVKARFREATEEEVYAVRGGLLWRILKLPVDFTYKVMGSIEILRARSNFASLGRDDSIGLVGRVFSWMGFKQEELKVTSIYSFFGNRHLVDGRAVLSAFLTQL